MTTRSTGFNFFLRPVREKAGSAFSTSHGRWCQGGGRGCLFPLRCRALWLVGWGCLPGCPSPRLLMKWGESGTALSQTKPERTLCDFSLSPQVSTFFSFPSLLKFLVPLNATTRVARAQKGSTGPGSIAMNSTHLLKADQPPWHCHSSHRAPAPCLVRQHIHTRHFCRPCLARPAPQDSQQSGKASSHTRAALATPLRASGR